MLLSALLLTLFPAALGFSFSPSSSSPTQCGTVDINWTGGTPPFRLLVLPAFDYPTNISLPDSAYDGSSGSYTWTVNYPANTDFVMLMSDATGVGTGGVSPLYKVGRGSSSCSLRSTNVDFYFALNETSVNQCGAVNIYWDNTAKKPVTILGAIPSGQPFMFQSTSANSIDWNTNIAAGTRFILAAFDNGEYGSGGSSAVLTVGGSSSSSCLDDFSPSSTPAGSPTATSTGTQTTQGGVKTVTAITTASAKGAAGLSTGAIVGIAVAAVVVVLVLQGALFYFCCRRQLAALISHRRQMRGREVKEGDVDLVDDPDALDDRSTSLHHVRTRDKNDRLSTSRQLGPRTRSSVGDTFDAESSVSPYWDLAPSAGPLSPNRGPFDSPPEEDFVPPPRVHLRNDSMSSNNSGAALLNLNLDTSPSMSSLPMFSPHLPYAQPHSASVSPRQSYNPFPSSTSGQASSGSSKAQMAAALSAQNPDNRAAPEFEGPYPQPEAPAGGYRFHYDAGRVDVEDAGREDVEDLPPVYRPEWETESQRGSMRQEHRRSHEE